jgi:hypothetical protein
MDNAKPNVQAIEAVLKNKNPGDKIELVVMQNNEKKEISIVLGKKIEKPFTISRKPGMNKLQKAILESWLK